MTQPDVIDAHVHLHKSIEKERQALPIPGRRDVDRWGNVEAIIPYMDREGISHIVALNLFPTPFVRRALRSKMLAGLSGSALEEAEIRLEMDLTARLRRHNEWLTMVASSEQRIIAGIGVQSGLMKPDDLVAEVEVRASQGAQAVKMLPGFYREYPNDRVFWPMYERCQELGLVIVSDTGTLGLGEHRAYPGEWNEVCYGEPMLFEEVLDDFPRLTLVMAHFPSAFWDQRVELARSYSNLMFDISGGFTTSGLEVRDAARALSEVDATRVMRRVGIERFMFGSDGPHVMAQPYIEQVLRLDLSDGEREAVLSGNARRMFDIR